MQSREGLRGWRRPGKAARRLQRLLLERRYRMRPGALQDVDLREIGYTAPNRVYEHVPSPWGVLRRILRRREVGHDDVFLEIGCGMGVVVVEAAARYHFRRVIGIDVVPQLTAVARETVARGRKRLRCKEVEIHTGDAMEYVIPDDVTVVYMADPFRGEVFDAVVANLLASVDRAPRRVRIIYFMPVEGGRLERTGRAALVRYGRRMDLSRSTTTDLGMYEIEPLGSAGSTERPSAPRRRGASRRLLPERFLNSEASSGAETVFNGNGAREATIQIVPAGGSSHGSTLVSADSASHRRALRAAFERDHCVRLPQLLSDPILDRIDRYVEQGEFSVPEHAGTSYDLCMAQGRAPSLLLFLLNDLEIFELARAITGCGWIGRFDGRLRRMAPGATRGEPWHGEIFGDDRVGMSIDLSGVPYSGGVLEIRDRYSRQVLHRTVDSARGDAVLFRLDSTLQRRVTRVEGDSPRTAFVGKFKSDTRSELVEPRASAQASAGDLGRRADRDRRLSTGQASRSA